MPDSLSGLEAGRSRIRCQFGSLGDLRAGSICAVVSRCGKPGCHCSKSGDAGHDPQVRLTRRVNGKTVLLASDYVLLTGQRLCHPGWIWGLCPQAPGI